MGATGKGVATDLPSLPISLKLQINKMHFSTHSRLPRPQPSSQKSYFWPWIPLGDRSHTSLEIVNLKGKEGIQGWRRRRVNSQVSRLLRKFGLSPKNPHHPELRITWSGFYSYGLSVFTTVPGTWQCHSADIKVCVLELVVLVKSWLCPLTV